MKREAGKVTLAVRSCVSQLVGWKEPGTMVFMGSKFGGGQRPTASDRKLCPENKGS